MMEEVQVNTAATCEHVGDIEPIIRVIMSEIPIVIVHARKSYFLP